MRLKKAFERYLQKIAYSKLPSDTGSIFREPTLGYSNLGGARSQLEAYRGHVYKCVTLIYRRAISVPFKLYKESGDTVREIKRHPFLDLIKKPNPYMSGSILKAITFMHRDLTGKAFWLKTLNGLGRPVEIWPLSVQDFRGFGFNEEGTIFEGYEFQHDGNKVIYAPEQIVYFRYPHPVHLLDGASPIQSQAFAYDMDLAMRVYQRNFFQTSARPDIVFNTDQEISPEDAKRFLLDWKMAHQGVDRSWEPAILDKGLDIKILATSNLDMEFASLARWTKEDILEAYNVPEGKLGSVATVDEANTKGIDITFNSECITPRLKSYEEEINISLLPMWDEGLYIEHEKCIPRDLEHELKERENNLRTFTTTINKERAKIGLSPAPWGHTPFVPVSMMQSDNFGGSKKKK